MSKTLSAKFYQENKPTLQKKLAKDIKIFVKRKQKKNNNMVMNVTKTYRKMKNKSLLIIEKILQNEKKRFIIKCNDLENSFEAINVLQKAYLNKKILKVYVKIDKKLKLFFKNLI